LLALVVEQAQVGMMNADISTIRILVMSHFLGFRVFFGNEKNIPYVPIVSKAVGHTEVPYE
jgi:hypothetical protein